MIWFFAGWLVGGLFFGALWWVARRRVKELEGQIVMFEQALAALEITAKRVR